MVYLLYFFGLEADTFMCNRKCDVEIKPLANNCLDNYLISSHKLYKGASLSGNHVVLMIKIIHAVLLRPELLHKLPLGTKIKTVLTISPLRLS